MTSIILIGFMGSGKTTIGKQLAHHLQIPHLDLDAWIERETGQSIASIFADQGESYFRDLESQALSTAIHQEGILSTGGGTPARLTNRNLLTASRCPVIFLRTSPDVIRARLNHDDSRPLLQDLNQEKFTQLFQEREGYYKESADTTIRTDNKTPDEITLEILEQHNYLKKQSGQL